MTTQTQFPRGNFAVWLCPFCGRTVKMDYPFYCMPNLSCEHRELPGVVYQMVLVWPRPEGESPPSEPSDA